MGPEKESITAGRISLPTLLSRLRLGQGVPFMALFGAAMVTYWNSLDVPFLLDDTASILENPSIRRLIPLGPVLSPAADAGTGGRPIANLSLALNHAFHGFDVRGYHLVNVLIHGAAASVLFALVRLTLLLPPLRRFAPAAAAPALAFAIALLWLVHPLHTETVTYISQRTEALMALFYLLTLHAFARFAVDEGRHWSGWAVVWCTLGMATKEVMVTAPVIVLLYDRTFIAGTLARAWHRRYRLHLSLAATWLLLLLLLRDVQERGVGYAAVGPWEYALTSCQSILLYLKLAFWPAPLVFDYGTGITRELATAWPFVSLLALLAAATLGALWRAPALGFAGVWVLGILAPASSVVPVAGQPMAEHRIYLPLAAIVAVIVIAAYRAWGRLIWPGVAVLALVLGGTTVVRNRDYQSAITLWADTVAKKPENGRAHASLGAAYLERGDHGAAVPALQRALQLDPGFAEAHNNLATALIDTNRVEESVAHYRAALKLRPNVASTHYNLGQALLRLGRADEALREQQEALRLRPVFAEARAALAEALVAAGRPAEALPHYREAVQLRPDVIAARFGLANALVHADRTTEAIPHYEATIAARPDAVEARYALGNALLAIGRNGDAVQHYTVAVRLRPDFAEAHHNLGNALALAGRPRDAISHYETALQLRPDFEASRANLEHVRKSVR